jgi:hypothetical protein
MIPRNRTLYQCPTASQKHHRLHPGHQIRLHQWSRPLPRIKSRQQPVALLDTMSQYQAEHLRAKARPVSQSCLYRLTSVVSGPCRSAISAAGTGSTSFSASVITSTSSLPSVGSGSSSVFAMVSAEASPSRTGSFPVGSLTATSETGSGTVSVVTSGWTSAHWASVLRTLGVETSAALG